jgi:hypothetical protein
MHSFAGIPLCLFNSVQDHRYAVLSYHALHSFAAAPKLLVFENDIICDSYIRFKIHNFSEERLLEYDHFPSQRSYAPGLAD